MEHSMHIIAQPYYLDTWEEDSHKDETCPPAESPWAYGLGGDLTHWNYPVSRWHFVARRREIVESNETLGQRLANANDYFKRKATEVVSDESALRLLAALYEAVVVDISEFDLCEDGLSLAKLTAASFCEIGATVVYITESGQRFIDSIKDA